MQKKLTKVAEAYLKSKPARDALRELDGICMEVTEDKAGIVWERWYLQTSPPLAVQCEAVNIILFATPTWWDVFTPITSDKEIAATVDAIKNLCK